MRFLVFLAVFVVSFVVSKAADSPKDWNEDVDWFTSLDDAMEVSRELHKPIMMVIHKSWCGACKALRPQFHSSKEIAKLSKYFVMVNAGDYRSRRLELMRKDTQSSKQDEDEPSGEQYRPDGGYIPRILFIENGEVRQDLINKKGNPKYKYYYNTADLVLETMKTAIDTMDLEAVEGMKEEL